MRKLVLVALFMGTPVIAQDVTELKATEVVSGMYMIEGVDGFAGGNITMLVGDEVFIIDDGVPPSGPLLIEMADKLAGHSVDYVVNTHVHGDHVGGNAAMAEDGGLIVAHDNIRRRLLEDTSLSGGPGGLPQLTFSDAVTFNVNGFEAHVFHVPAAHTDGDAVIHFRNVDVIHAGDLFFNDLFPFIDQDNGGTVAGFKAGQQRILDMAGEDTIIIPGHGPLATRIELQVALDMLIDAEARVKKLVDEGMNEEQILTENPLAVYHEQWNWGFITTERMTKGLFRSLSNGQ